MTAGRPRSGHALTDALTDAMEAAARRMARVLFPPRRTPSTAALEALDRLFAAPPPATPWSTPAADPIGDLRAAMRAIKDDPDPYGLGRTPPPMPSSAARDLYPTGEGAGVARALGVPVFRTDELRYGTVVEDRTTGELRLWVGTRRTFDDTLATVRREAAGIALTVLAGYGEPAYHARRRRQLAAEAFLEELAGQAVAEAR